MWLMGSMRSYGLGLGFGGPLLAGGLSIGVIAVIGGLGACSSTAPGSPGAGSDGGADATLTDANDGSQPEDVSREGGDGTAPDTAAEATVEGGEEATTDAPADVAEAAADVTDAPADSPVADVVEAGPCLGVMCNGQCLAASDCRTCAGATLLCGPSGACVTSCSGCGGSNDASMPIECFACDGTGKNPLGTCQPDDPSAYCLNGRYAGQYVNGANGYVCSCDDAGTSCPGKTQVCTALGQSTFCLTCGEVSTGALQDAGCQGGGICNELTHKCL